MVKPDNKLATVEEISARMESIKRQIDRLESIYDSPRYYSSNAFKARSEKLAKLNSRYDALWARRAKLMED